MKLRTRVLAACVLLTFAVSVPAFAQNHVDVVARVKAESGAGAFTSVDTMLQLVLKVIAELPDEHLGLVRSSAGSENTARYGNELVRVNRVLYPNGTMIKILGDSGPSPLSGNVPQWNQEETGAGALYVPVIPNAPPPPIVVPPPAQPPPIVLPSDAELVALVKSILETQQQGLAIAKDTNARVTNMDRTLTQTLGAFSKFAAKYIAPSILTWYVTHTMMDDAPKGVTQ